MEEADTTQQAITSVPSRRRIATWALILIVSAMCLAVRLGPPIHFGMRERSTPFLEASSGDLEVTASAAPSSGLRARWIHGKVHITPKVSVSTDGEEEDDTKGITVRNVGLLPHPEHRYEPEELKPVWYNGQLVMVLRTPADQPAGAAAAQGNATIPLGQGSGMLDEQVAANTKQGMDRKNDSSVQESQPRGLPAQQRPPGSPAGRLLLTGVEEEPPAASPAGGELGLLPQGTATLTLSDRTNGDSDGASEETKAVNDLVENLFAARDGAQQLQPTEWFEVSLERPMYIVLVWGSEPSDLDVHLYSPAACKHCGRIFRIDQAFPGRHNADPWAEFQKSSSAHLKRIVMYRKKPHGLQHVYISNPIGWRGEGSPADLAHSNATVYIIDWVAQKKPQLLASFFVSAAQGNYGNFWDVFTLECTESRAPDPTQQAVQRCLLHPVQQIQQAEPTWQPAAERDAVRIEMRDFSVFSHIVENIFSFLGMALLLLLCCVACALLATRSERGNRILYDLAGRAQRARIISVGRTNRYTRVLPEEQDAFLASDDPEARELEGTL